MIMPSDDIRSETGRYPLWRVIETLRTINATSTTLDLLQYVINEACFISGIEKATALLWEDESGCYRLKATTHLSHESERDIILTRDEAHQRYLDDVRPLYDGIYIIDNVNGRAAEEKIKSYGLPKSMVVMPIPVEGEIDGFLVFDNMTTSNAIRSDDLQILHLLREPFISALIKIKMIDQLQRVIQRKSDFLQLVAHDIRNPLQAILGYADMLLHDNRTGHLPRFRKDISIIHAAGKRIMDLVSRLLEIAMVDSQTDFRLVPDDLFQVIEECVDSMAILATQKNITITAPERISLPLIQLNRPALHQVLENLLSNAIKYTSPGGAVSVFVELRPSEVVVHVEDTGLGLSAEDLRYVFRQIKKLSSKPTANESSVGLGLVLVKKILDRHRGRIWVESEKGKGSRFSFALPLHRVRTNELGKR